MNEKPTKEQIKFYHTMASRMGWDDDQRRAFLAANYGRESCTELTRQDMVSVNRALHELLDHADRAEMDRARKKCIAVICTYLKTTGQPTSLDYIKAVATHATGASSFNHISRADLSRLIGLFREKTAQGKK